MHEIQAAIEYLQPRVSAAVAMEMASAFRIEARDRQLDALLLVALAMAESSLNPRKVNTKTGAAGLMQLMPSHWNYWRAPAEALRIRTNVAVGSEIFARCYHNCGNRTGHAVTLWGGYGSCRDSRFSRKVMRIRESLRRYEKVTS